MQQFQEYDNEGYNISRCLFDVEQNSKLHFMTCGEVFFCSGWIILLGQSIFTSSSKNKWQKPHIQLYLGYTKPMRDNVKYWQCSNIRVLCFKSLIYWWSFSRNHGNDVQLLFVHPVRVSDCYFSYSLISKSNVRFHYFHYWVNVLHSTNWRKRNGENCLNKTNLHKELKNHTGYGGNNHYVTQLLFSQNSLLYIARGSDYFLMEIYSKIFSCTNHARWWLGDFPKYKIGHTVEALFSGKLFDGFFIPPQNTWQGKYARNKFPGARL